MEVKMLQDGVRRPASLLPGIAALILVVLDLGVGTPLRAAALPFVIEAEDFNYGSGQTLAVASQMPYYGGAYNGRGATAGVDYNSDDGNNDSDLYRAGEYPYVNITTEDDVDRGDWIVTSNYRIGWISGNDWFNYTRTFPNNYYKVYAALSHYSTTAGALHGTLYRVTSGATTSNQTLEQVGVFDAPGSGGWGLNNLVPLRDSQGQSVLLQLNGTHTFRYWAASGDVDYYKFVVAGPPQIADEPDDVVVMENRPATFTVTVANEDIVNYQWQSNRVSIGGATNAAYTFAPPRSASGALYRCLLSNPLGSATSREALLTVTNDLVQPHVLSAVNLGSSSVRLVFDEPVAVPAGSASSSFSLNHGASVLSASAGSVNNEIVLSVSPLTYGVTYTVTISNVPDLAQTPNVIQPGSTVVFIASEYAPGDVGGPSLAGSVARLPGDGFEVVGSGAEIGGTSDQFHFAWEQRTNDFDIQTRVSGVTITDPFVQAGLMVRETLAANARFAGVFGSSAQLGCFFEARSSVGGASSTASIHTRFPVNYPQTWLRLRRVGTTLYGFASLDGKTWTQLGTQTLSGLPSVVYFGLAVCSSDAARATSARFWNVGVAASTTTGTYIPEREWLGASSRHTGLVFSEIMYHPPARADLKELEFIEIYNGRSVEEDLTGWRISGDVDYEFPAGFKLQAGAFAVVAAVPADVAAVYGLTNVLGPFTNRLSNAGGTLRLRNGADAIRLEVSYGDSAPWPLAADGVGHSMVLANPSYGENDPRAWVASERVGGSPGDVDAVYPAPERAVVINEALTHTDLPQVDFVELYNRSTVEADLSGCVITDDVTTNRFRIPNGTRIPGGGHMAFDAGDLGFSLDAGGETLFLINSNATRLLDVVRFGAQENGVATGRCPDGSSQIRRLAQPTFGAANANWRLESVVFNEIMFNPISGDGDEEYLELFNRGAAALDLSGWRLTDGVDYKFPANTVLPAGGYLVVGKNQQRLLAKYSQLNTNNTRGNFDGSLANSGERIALQMPDEIVDLDGSGGTVTNTINISVAEVVYGEGGRWGRYADAGGSSLELIDAAADPLQPDNWRDSDESAKGSWTSVSVTGVLDNGGGGMEPDRLFIGMLGAGECMVDDVVVMPFGGANLVSNGSFGSGAAGWSFFGNHSISGVEAGVGYLNGYGLRVRSTGDCDTGPNTIRTSLAAGLSQGTTATISARVRWVAGWPEVLFRLHGNFLELPARASLPGNLGTPGLVNSRAIPNAGPAIYDVTHYPAVPQSGESILITCRFSDSSALSTRRVRYRVDPSTTLSLVSLRDDGLAGDRLANDGVYSGTIPAQGVGTLLAYRVEASDDAGSTLTVFPSDAPTRECLVRWGDPLPFGNFPHYHLWLTSATLNAWNSVNGLDNTWRDTTLVYNNGRVIYNVSCRDKGSPYHGGRGDIACTTPLDEPLLGATDRVLGSIGNGGNDDPTSMRSQVAAWVGQQMGVPYLHSQYIFVYRNGSAFRPVMEDLEQPNHNHAESWFPDAADGDLYKVAVWFEFQDNNSGFNATGATIERFTTTGGAYKPARYRWNWQRRPNDGLGSNFTNLLDLVTVINAPNDAAYVPRLLGVADMDQWMRSYIYSFAMGNWDVWTYSVGQNMYAYKPDGLRWVLMPWDIDFTLGLGDGPGGTMWGGQDPVMNTVYNLPEFRRMVWRAYQDVVNGPYQTANYLPQIEMRRRLLIRNGVTGLQDGSAIASYIEARRGHIQGQLSANDNPTFAISNNGGNNYTSTTPTTTLTGTAPFAVAVIEVNGVPYPVTWTGFNTFSIPVPLTQAVNVLNLVAKDRLGNVLPGLSDTITVTYTGVVQAVQDYVVINEIQYNGVGANTSFLELYNRSTTTAFDLSGFRLDGVGYVFPEGAILPAGGYLVLAKDRAAFAAAYGGTVPVFDEFPGNLDNGGEHVALVKPGASPEEDVVVSDVRYNDKLPWPLTPDGQGPSLQLVDASRGAWRVANWSATATNAANRVTPAAANAGIRSLPAFPNLWINEVLPQNANGATDAAGQHEPWIEIHNAGTTTVDLSSYYLTDNYTNLTAWSFPAGASIAPGGFYVIWADGEPGSVDPTWPHASFRLNPTNGSVALVRLQGSPSAPAVMDYVNYVLLTPDRSFGAYPDGEPRTRRLLHYPTLAGTNDPASPAIQVTINEWMSRNTSTVQDPADGDYNDWFELHNAGSETVDLASYTLTDNLTNATQFRIPAGYMIPPGGFLLVWADDETGQNEPTNSGLHVSFQLAASGEQIGLFGPDGLLVDGITFGAQTNDVSAGRFPDGGSPPLVDLEEPTPGSANILAGANLPPAISGPDATNVIEMVALSFTVTATGPEPGQSVVFSLAPDAPAGASIDANSGLVAWTPSEAHGPGIHNLTVRATDNGVPIRTGTKTIAVTVLESNRPPVLAAVANQVVAEGSLLGFTLSASDPDQPANVLTYSLAPGVPAGLTVDPVSGAVSWTPTEAQGPNVHNVIATVTDNGTPAASHSQSFTITVNEVNNPPDMPLIGPQSVQELSAFSYVVQATDPDSPSAPIVFSLETAPEGARINTTTGEITWTPTEAQGPMDALFVVRATENVAGGLYSSRTFGVAVSERNQGPTLAPIGDFSVPEGGTVAFQAVGSDADLPAQTLTYSLDAGAPAGATIDAATGAFTWATAADQGASTNTVWVRVTDSYAFSTSQRVIITVVPSFKVVIHEIMHHPSTPGAGYVELANLSGTTTVDLAGMALTGKGLNYTFPAGTQLAPQSFLCVAEDSAVFAATYGGGLAVVGPWSGDFIFPDTLDLRQGTNVLDRVSFDQVSPWPTEASGAGGSLQLIDPWRDNNRVGNWAAVAPASGPLTLVASNALWRYYELGPVAATWRDPAFDDGAWPSGGALLYVEEQPLAWPKTTPLTHGRTTYYFRTRFNLGAVPSDASLELWTFIDDGAVFWLNGQELPYRLNMLDGAVTYDTLAPSAISDASLQGPVLLPADLLQPGENVLAVEVHQVAAGTGSSDIVLGLALNLLSDTLPAFTPGAPNNVAATLPEFPDLRLNEVLARNGSGLTDRVGDRDPWIELFNPGTAAVSLDGLYLTDDVSAPNRWAFPGGWSIGPGEFLVVFADGEPAETDATELHTAFRLPSSGGVPWSVLLTRSQGTGAAVVDYLQGVVPGVDVALGRVPDGTSEGATVLAAPSPGASNAVMVPDPEFIAATVDGAGAPVLTWSTAAGRSYRLEYQSVLDPSGPWQPLQTLPAGGTQLTWTDSTAVGLAKRYYRVVLEP